MQVVFINFAGYEDMGITAFWMFVMDQLIMLSILEKHLEKTNAK